MLETSKMPKAMSTSITALPSLDQIAVAEQMSGRHGSNRSTGKCQLSAETDQEAVLAWLARAASQEVV